MPYNQDKQWNLSVEEQDKVRRRAELQRRVKEEGIRKRWDPYRTMRREPFVDPAIERFVDLRKKGRCPNSPMPAKTFYKMLAFVFVPITLVSLAVHYERKDWLEGCKSGDIPYEKRPFVIS